jgi:hypothetical protein
MFGTERTAPPVGELRRRMDGAEAVPTNPEHAVSLCKPENVAISRLLVGERKKLRQAP